MMPADLSQVKPWLCFECNAPISDDEYVVNWGSCDTCLDESLTEYFKNDAEANQEDDT